MSFQRTTVSISRLGVPLAASPFQGRVYAVRRSASGQNVPKIAEAQRGTVLSLDDMNAPVAVGDLVTLADGTLFKLLEVRRYDFSLQCDLQRVPFTPLTLWRQKTQAERTDPKTLKVSDVSFVPLPAPLLGYLEPAPDEVKMMTFGVMDLRAAFLFTLEKIAQGMVVKDTFGDYWQAELASDVWPLPGDYKTIMRHLTALPAGVT